MLCKVHRTVNTGDVVYTDKLYNNTQFSVCGWVGLFIF